MSITLLQQEQNLRLAYLKIKEAERLAENAGFIIASSTIAIESLNNHIVDLCEARGVDKDDVSPDAKMYKIRKEFYNSSGTLSLDIIHDSCRCFSENVASDDNYKIESVTSFVLQDVENDFGINFRYKNYDGTCNYLLTAYLDYCGIVVSKTSGNYIASIAYADACKQIFADLFCEEIR